MIPNAIAKTLGEGGGARRFRTDDLMLAKHALYQLSYGPKGLEPLRVSGVDDG